MANAINPTQRQVSKPYLTLQEFKNAPTALDYGNLVVGGNQSAQDAELSNAILRASSWMDQYCNQIIGATVDVEQQRVRIRPDGTMRIHPRYFPIVALTSLSFGYAPNQLTAVPDCSIAWLEDQEIIFPYASAPLNWSSQGPLAFGFPASSRNETYVNYTYVNGYANTTIGAAATAGQTVLTVADGSGIVAGQQLTVFDGASTEAVTVASNYTFNSTTVPLASALLFSHAAGTSVSALPAAIKEAAILVTSSFLKIRGDASLTMGVTNVVSGETATSTVFGSDIDIARELLKPFRRIR